MSRFISWPTLGCVCFFFLFLNPALFANLPSSKIIFRSAQAILAAVGNINETKPTRPLKLCLCSLKLLLSCLVLLLCSLTCQLIMFAVPRPVLAGLLFLLHFWPFNFCAMPSWHRYWLRQHLHLRLNSRLNALGICAAVSG